MQSDVQSYQVDEGQELPAAPVGLVCRHVQSFVVAEDGEVRQQDGDPENLRGDQRHDARSLVSVYSSTFTSLRLLLPLRCCLVLILPAWTSLPVSAPLCSPPSVYCFRVMVMMQGGGRRGEEEGEVAL